MKFTVLAALLIALHKAFGPPENETHFQEDCAGQGMLTAGVRMHGLKAQRRDVARLIISAHGCVSSFSDDVDFAL